MMSSILGAEQTAHTTKRVGLIPGWVSTFSNQEQRETPKKVTPSRISEVE